LPFFNSPPSSYVRQSDWATAHEGDCSPRRAQVGILNAAIAELTGQYTVPVLQTVAGRDAIAEVEQNIASRVLKKSKLV